MLIGVRAEYLRTNSSGEFLYLFYCISVVLLLSLSLPLPPTPLSLIFYLYLSERGGSVWSERLHYSICLLPFSIFLNLSSCPLGKNKPLLLFNFVLSFPQVYSAFHHLRWSPELSNAARLIICVELKCVFVCKLVPTAHTHVLDSMTPCVSE